jgi:IAA-amino acid hydrolase
MAGAGSFEVVMKGKGGHAAAGVGLGVVDPLVAAAAAVTALQNIVAREVAPVDQAVLSVTMIHGGDAYNVVPNQVTFGGTLRAFSRKTYDLIETRAKEIIRFTAAAYGCEVELFFTSFSEDCLKTTGLPAAFASGCTYPPVINDDETYSLAKGAAKSLLGAEFVTEATATMGGEDFAYFAEKVPANFVYLGIGNAEKNTTAGLHSPNFKLDEEALPVGVALHATIVLHALQDLGGLAPHKAEL